MVDDLEVFASAKLATVRAEQHDRIARFTEPAAHDAIRVLEQPDNANDRRWINRRAVGLVVQADIPAGDGHTERAARGANPFDRLRELPHDPRTLGVSEVEAVGRTERPGPGARDISGRLRDREHRAAIRVE